MDKTQKFEYNELDLEKQQFVRDRTEKIKNLAKRSSQDIIDIGKYLIEVKQSLGWGHFYSWLKSEFDWSESAATKFMQVAREFNSVNVTELDVTSTALYALAQPSLSPEVRAEALRLGKAKERITKETVNRIKAELQPEILSKSEAKEDSSQKIRDEEQTQWENETVLVATTQPTKEKLSLLEAKPQIVTVRPPQNWHRLGKHSLYNGLLTSEEFKQRLPKKINLLIDFSFRAAYSQEIEAISYLSISTSLTRVDWDDDYEIVREALELYTETDDFVVFALLPSPDYLLHAHRLDCQCYIAEPNWERCEKTIKIWEEMEKNR